MKKNSRKKVNPLMDNKKIKNINLSSSDESNEIRNFIFIVFGIIVILAIIFGLTELLNKNDNVEEVSGEVSINYDRLSIGMLLNRPYDEYYVLLYDSKDNNSILYSTILSMYMAKSDNEDYVKIYYCDLNNKINSVYYNVNGDNKSNSKAETISELDLGDLTLIKVKKGKIVSYLEDYDKIKDVLN